MDAACRLRSTLFYKINVFAGASPRGIGLFKALSILQSIHPFNLFLSIPYTLFFRLLFSLSTLFYYLLSLFFHTNYDGRPTYPFSSHRNAAFETSSWSRRLNHLHSRQRCPYRDRCWPHCLSPVSFTSFPKILHLLFPSWRDRGKAPEPNKLQPHQQLPTPQPLQLLPPPPPPYQQGEWQPAGQVAVSPPTPVQVTPRSIRKSRQLQVASPSKRPIVYHRKSRSRMQAPSPPIHTTPPTHFPSPQPEFNFGLNQEDQVEQTPLEDKVGLSLSFPVDRLILTVHPV